jgi:hypothetical protein
MAVTTNHGGTDRQRETRRSARRREMVEGVLLLAVLIVLAIVSRLPSG